MRYRVVLIVVLLVVVHMLFAVGIWWVGRPPAAAAVVRVETPTPAAFERLAELYASAAFRSAITFDYATLSELIARSTAWPDVLYVSVEDHTGQILAHSDRSNIGRMWDPAMADALKAKFGAAYREVATSIDGRPSGSTPSVGQVRLAYTVSGAPMAPESRERVPLGMLLGAATLLAIPLGLLLSRLQSGTDAARKAMGAQAEQHRIVLRRLSEAEREIERLRAEAEALAGGIEAARLRVDEEVRQRHARAVGYIVHAIRSSLTNVLGFSKLLLRGSEGPLTDAQRADALNIHFAGKHLLAVVNDLVELTQLENDTLKLKEDLVDVGAVLAETAAAAVLPGRSASDVVVDCPPTLPPVKTDRGRLAQILETLVEQAPEGVPLTLRARGGEDAVELVVTWPRPLAAKSLDELCEPFPATNVVSPLQDGGRRLRLAVVRRLALASGGTLGVDHAAGATTFTLTLPAAIGALTVA
jgi:signal transduction histidine kinase